MTAVRAPEGEGAMPARNPLPTLHKGSGQRARAHAAHGLEQLEQVRQPR
jgi:hypothetical protein